MSKTTIIREVEMHYANILKSHAPFGDEVWDVQVRTTDEAQVAEFEAAGVKMKQHKDGYWHANIKRRVKNRKGEPNDAVKVVDAAKNPWDPAKRIGHGTIGNLKLFTYDWEQMGRKGTSAMLNAVQITNLVEYKGSEEVDFDVVESSTTDDGDF